MALFGIATIVFALSKSFILSMAALAVLGASDAVSVVIRFTLVQIETPDDMRGRVNAVNSLFTGTSNQLGDFRAGAMAAWLGAIPAVLVGGVGILLVRADLDARVSGAGARQQLLQEAELTVPASALLGLGRRGLGEPVIEERLEPGAAGRIVDRAVGEMSDPRLGVRQQRALVPARGPAAHHRVRHVRMELQRVGRSGSGTPGSESCRLPPATRRPCGRSKPSRCHW